MPRARQPLVVALSVVLAVLVAGCGGEDRQPDAVEWRNVSLDVPDSWYVYERSDDHLSISNADLGPRDEADGEFVAPDDGVVSMNFTFEPNTVPDDWRRFVDEQDATLETDQSITLDEDVPATQLVFSYTSSSGSPTREMVVVIPSRAIVVLSQPVPSRGATDAPEVFLTHIETFLEVLESAEFGRPVME
ncbi:MAG TPA: hypothetical protein VK906_08260 [Egicoccus sp.]|nr:hypothetical protein [Egicoccus sp.]HSK23153.1 hypothetical protein [Egicoccus sp.]